MGNSQKYIKAGLSASRALLLFFLFLYSVGFLAASLMYDGVSELSARAIFDPFDTQAAPYLWINLTIWILAFVFATVAFFLYRKFLTRIDQHPFRNTYRFVSIVVLFALGIVANQAAWVSVGKLNLSEQRRDKVIKLYGQKEDMCAVLKVGMTKNEMLEIMGQPPGMPPVADCRDEKGCPIVYCPEAGDCRAVTLGLEQTIIKIECWTGKAIGLPIE